MSSTKAERQKRPLEHVVGLDELLRQRSDLSLLVLRLARRLICTETPNQARAAGNRKMANDAADYLRRKGLTSPLRAVTPNKD